MQLQQDCTERSCGHRSATRFLLVNRWSGHTKVPRLARPIGIRKQIIPHRNQLCALLVARRKRKKHTDIFTSTIPTLTVAICTRRNLRSCLYRCLSDVITAMCFPTPSWISTTYAAKHVVAKILWRSISRLDQHRQVQGHIPNTSPWSNRLLGTT